MILVTLGTHPAPMDRVVRELDRLIEVGALADEVVIQAASFRLKPRLARSEGVIAYGRLRNMISTAEIVISHAGPATLAEIRSAGRVPVVIPRSPARKEHVDDHQERYARRLQGQPGYIVVEDVSGLGPAIEGARGLRPAAFQADVAAAVAALERILRD